MVRFNNFLASTVTHFLNHYMVPVTDAAFPGYRVKAEFAHLLPPTLGRPQNYCLTPYCLPDYDPLCVKAMADYEISKKYVGCHNTTFQ